MGRQPASHLVQPAGKCRADEVGRGLPPPQATCAARRWARTRYP